MRVAALVALAAVVGAGCGIDDPYAERRQAEQARKLQPAGPGPPAATPQEAVRRVALTWANWSTRTVAEQHRRAIALTVGEATRQLQQQSIHVENGAVEAVDPLRSRATLEALALRGSGDRRRAIVVTREKVTGGADVGSDTAYQVTLATVERGEDGWVISRWARQQ